MTLIYLEDRDKFSGEERDKYHADNRDGYSAVLEKGGPSHTCTPAIIIIIIQKYF